MKIMFAGFRHGHIEALYKTASNKRGVEITACSEEDEQARMLYTSKLGIRFDSRSYEELLSTDADIVAIGACYGDRGEMIVKALRAGKHVISDKPLCITMEELDNIERAAVKHHKKIGCMLDLRYLPATIKANEILKDGVLGEIRNISFSGQHCIDYANRPRWYFEHGKHGGTINDLAIHGIDLINHLTGLEIKTVNAARCWNAFAVKNSAFKDAAIFMAELTNGAGLLADVSYAAPLQVFSMPTYWNFKFWCENGLMTFNFIDKDVSLYINGENSARIESGIDCDRDCLDDLLREINSDTQALTKSIINTTRQTMKIQAFCN